tara:strand:- start:9377 stop:11788 length:2412 start_codon:yes stop_codon:yes gene_type:complete
MAKIKHNNFMDTIDEVISKAKEKGVVHLYANGNSLKGRTIEINHKVMYHFGTTGYLGLEQDIRLKDAAAKAIYDYGTQFPLSKTYISHPLYATLEEKISQMYGQPIIITKNSTLGHLAVIPTVVRDEDTVILDHQVHWSVQSAAAMLKTRGIPVEMIRHNNLDMLESKIKEHAGKSGNIWYMADGVYSMYGDFAPVKELMVLSEKYPQLQLYIDDVHGMSWQGKHGTGFFASNFKTLPENALVFGTLSKTFGASGALLVCPDKKKYNQIKNFGGPLTFSAQLEPASVAAAIASANIHLSDEIYSLQQDLNNKIKLFNKLLQKTELPLVNKNNSPVFYIGTGMPETGYNFVKKMMDEGFFVNLGLFPAVPVKNTGVRITIARHNQNEDIQKLVEAMAYLYPKALIETQTSLQRVCKLFKIEPKTKTANSNTVQELNLIYTNDINQIDQRLWNNTIGKNNCCDYNGMKFLQEAFSENKEQENNWKFHYFLVNDKLNNPILLTFFTTALWKDDMLAPISVSQKLEVFRTKNKYYGTSKVTAMGSAFSEGNHLFNNKKHPDWKKAWTLLLLKLEQITDKENSKMTLLRDFTIKDKQLDTHFNNKGFIKIQMPEACILNNPTWSSHNNFKNQLSKRSKRHFKNDIEPYLNNAQYRISNELDPNEIQKAYTLYKAVKNNNLALNTFTYPRRLFDKMNKNPQWEYITLYKKETEATPKNMLGIMFCYKNSNKIYVPSLIGMDYSFTDQFQTYRQLLYNTIRRAAQLKCKSIDFGISATFEKQKLGATAIPMWAYLQSDDNFILEKLELIK